MSRGKLRRPRIFVLGAGFSAPAGLPLATGLLDLVLGQLRRVGNDGHLSPALEDYLSFVESTTGKRPVKIDLEDFAAYLDYEHFFGMLGSDTWSLDGNRSQFQLRWGIGRVLHRLTPKPADLPQSYLRFADGLQPRDVVVTFNYDRVLETALDRVGKPYRRFPSRYATVGPYLSTVDTRAESSEILLVKVHGSVDWVSTESFKREQALDIETGDASTADFSRRRDLLFGSNPLSPIHSLIEGPHPKDHPLTDIEVLEDLDAYYSEPNVLYYYPPVVLAPSTAKQLYGRALAAFWTGMGNFAWYWGGLSIIGYSLPAADPYARQVLYRLARGYLRGLRDPDPSLGSMRPMEVVSLKTSASSRQSLRETYRFMDPAETRFFFGGFDEDAVEALFN